MDRDFAKAMMRHCDAIDLLLGAMSEIARTHAPEDERKRMLSGIFKCVDELHVSTRRPILDAYPDLDRDQK